jgi:hypothetical protein
MSKKLYLVETISIFRMRYAIEAKNEEHALEEVTMNATGDCNDKWEDFSQKHIEEVIISSREITKKEYIEIYDKDNAYFKVWSPEQKSKFIMKIDYKK